MVETVYSMKWLKDNLGITSEMVRNYEKKGLMVKGANRNLINNYREYSKEQVEKLWAIKVLISIGFTTAEIKKFMTDSNYDFDVAIAQKVEKLEKKQLECTEALEYAKTIKLTGRVPNVTTLGSMKFDEFISIAKKEWNIFKDPQFGAAVELADLMANRSEDLLKSEEFDKIVDLFEQMDLESIQYSCQLHAYCQLIAELKMLDYKDKSVQTAVKILYEYLMRNRDLKGLDEELLPKWFSKYFASSFINGDVAVVHERNFGKEGCIFIAKAVAHFGGYEDIWEL